MIDYLRGRVAHITPEYVVLDVRDVGYRVFTPNPYALARNDDAVQLFIHHHVREDAILLFGFPEREEQMMFRRLLEVPGIGPKGALGVLAGARPQALAAAIAQENVGFLVKLPGIGKKTAQRMILDLKDKLSVSGVSGVEAAATAFAVGAPQTAGEGGSAWSEAREALAGLGYRDAELDKVWLAMKGSVTGAETVDALMKKALQQLFQG